MATGADAVVVPLAAALEGAVLRGRALLALATLARLTASCLTASRRGVIAGLPERLAVLNM